MLAYFETNILCKTVQEIYQMTAETINLVDLNCVDCVDLLKNNTKLHYLCRFVCIKISYFKCAYMLKFY